MYSSVSSLEIMSPVVSYWGSSDIMDSAVSESVGLGLSKRNVFILRRQTLAYQVGPPFDGMTFYEAERAELVGLGPNLDPYLLRLINGFLSVEIITCGGYPS